MCRKGWVWALFIKSRSLGSGKGQAGKTIRDLPWEWGRKRARWSEEKCHVTKMSRVSCGNLKQKQGLGMKVKIRPKPYSFSYLISSWMLRCNSFILNMRSEKVLGGMGSNRSQAVHAQKGQGEFISYFIPSEIRKRPWFSFLRSLPHHCAALSEMPCRELHTSSFPWKG